MEKEKLDKIYLSHGSDWPEHEDYLVGNREGLEILVKVVNDAIDNGESKADLHEFVGVRCLETEFFEKEQGSTGTLHNIVGWSILAGVGFILILGIKTIIGWF